MDTQPSYNADEKTVFISSEELKGIEQAIDKLEKAQQELQKAAEGMKPLIKEEKKKPEHEV